MFGIDAGGTFLKMGEPSAETMEMHPLPYSAEWLNRELEGTTSPYLMTGAGSITIEQMLPDYHFTVIPEIDAIGLGGAYLAGLDRCVVINIGSGTPILSVDLENKEVKHISGTGIGSASLSGLAYYMTGMMELERIDEKAFEGNADVVNLLIQDIYEDPERVRIPGNATASNFGKYQDWRHISNENRPETRDLLAALHRMVAEVLAIMANLACKTIGRNDMTVVVTGGGTLNRALLKYLKISFDYLSQPYIIPSKAVFGTLFGLFVHEGMI